MFSSTDFHLIYFTFDWFLERVAAVAVGEVGEGLKPCTVDAVIKRKKGNQCCGTASIRHRGRH